MFVSSTVRCWSRVQDLCESTPVAHRESTMTSRLPFPICPGKPTPSLPPHPIRAGLWPRRPSRPVSRTHQGSSSLDWPQIKLPLESNVFARERVRGCLASYLHLILLWTRRGLAGGGYCPYIGLRVLSMPAVLDNRSPSLP